MLYGYDSLSVLYHTFVIRSLYQLSILALKIGKKLMVDDI